MASCQLCQLDGLIWSENIDPQTGKKFLFNENTGRPHRCQIKPNPIRLYDNIGGILFDRREESIARDIVEEAVKAKLDPYRVRVVRQGGFLILK